jgi:hypothetical protein
MSMDHTSPSAALPNGSGAAAILAAGIGAFLLALLGVAADRMAGLRSLMVFYKPTGPLSGVTTSALVMWLVSWAVLNWRWRRRNVALARINRIALALLGLSLLLTFPPVADLF